jgi:DNA-binding transcriptional MerR regulator
MARPRPRSTVPAASAWEPTFRSGAVARLAAMPVATLRIWEQRHQAVRPGTTASGHRLYSQADVDRVRLLRQLTGQGHGIGSLAALETAQLQALARSHEDAPARLAESAPGPAPAPRRASARRGRAPLRLAVVGRALADRLQRPTVGLRVARPLRIVAVFDTLADARGASGGGASADLLLWQSPALPAELPPELPVALSACRAPRAAVLYRFGSAASRRAFTAAGTSVAREPGDDEALADWLAAVVGGSSVDAGRRRSATAERSVPKAANVAPRRFDDAALTAIAGLPATVACECPRHLAELLLQLAGFESYSAACVDRSPADAALHADLQRTAGRARVLFEAALERVARHEGLRLG